MSLSSRVWVLLIEAHVTMLQHPSCCVSHSLIGGLHHNLFGVEIPLQMEMHEYVGT